MVLNNVQFHESTLEKRDLCIVRFVNMLNSFRKLEVLQLKGVNNAPLVFKSFAQHIGNLTFASTLKEIEVNACILKMSHDQLLWVGEESQPAPVEIYEDLRDFILKFDNLERLYLIGIALVDHL